MVAHHWQEAGEDALAARWHWRAAEWATYRDPLDALRRWRLMLDLLDGLEETAEIVELGVMARARLLRVAARMALSNADRDELYESARTLAERSTDKRLLARLLWSYGASFYMAGELRDARTNVWEAVRLADEIGDAGLSAAFRVGTGVLALVIGPLSIALEESQLAIDLTDGDSDVGTEFLGYSPLVRCTVNRSMIYTLMGRFEESRADADRGLAAARRVAELESVVIGLYARNLWAFHAGHDDGALLRARETIEAAEMGTRYLHTYAWEGMGMACLLGGRFEDAFNALERAAALVGEGAGGFQEASILALLSTAHASTGKAERALDVATQAVEVARARGARVFEAHALIRSAQARRLLGQDETRVGEDVALARAVIEETGAYGYERFLDDVIAP